MRLEEDDGTVVDTIAWKDGTAPEDFFQSLVMAVRASGEDLGTGLNDPTESVQTLSNMLVQVARLRSQEPLGHRNTLRRVIEFRNDWYFTERHVIPAAQLSYTIEVRRLNEMDWEDHLWRRFDGSEDALSFARTLYGVPRPEKGFPADNRRNGDDQLEWPP
ncbi:hypothetical protein [Microbacterium sp. P02]|uniref:hypothetical protein n=1 Tax=Microbacterium sp. P02 TaxID=3366260 RepID=UPI0036710F5A